MDVHRARVEQDSTSRSTSGRSGRAAVRRAPAEGEPRARLHPLQAHRRRRPRGHRRRDPVRALRTAADATYGARNRPQDPSASESAASSTGLVRLDQLPPRPAGHASRRGSSLVARKPVMVVTSPMPDPEQHRSDDSAPRRDRVEVPIADGGDRDPRPPERLTAGLDVRVRGHRARPRGRATDAEFEHHDRNEEHEEDRGLGALAEHLPDDPSAAGRAQRPAGRGRRGPAGRGGAMGTAGSRGSRPSPSACRRVGPGAVASRHPKSIRKMMQSSPSTIEDDLVDLGVWRDEQEDQIAQGQERDPEDEQLVVRSAPCAS